CARYALEGENFDYW
nr:immunoglobulin heavy chain junction region [Macaca mulatta]MOW18927.1 immunoglobulin heavy chain junction region [Macaca mulatta]MOW19144.1 immunoglobulin heavy chain junction region [Macaca mulatta]MOW19496.1 immunoglobulin heavy chain junction region [Macaca mulatta]MOW21620.1 immunoglobulin heavy chain junction region [Macaca mulatta]